jgi:hypothetical protein
LAKACDSYKEMVIFKLRPALDKLCANFKPHRHRLCLKSEDVIMPRCECLIMSDAS